MENSALKAKEPTTQEVCIDLPGETVQCWRSGSKLKVILRKHRDVIFDLNLGGGKTYTVRATDSDFYNARDKRLVYAKRHEAVNFNDGERLHLWVTRGFKGALILECNNQNILKIKPNEFDPHQYDHSPKTKPAPIIVALDNRPEIPAAPVKKTIASVKPIKAPVAAAAPVDEECAVICVVDGSLKGMPEIFNFSKGGGNSGLVDIDPFDVATRNWIWGQVVGSGAFIKDNWQWLRASLDERTHQGFRLVRAQVHYVRGKIRFYFSGYSKFNSLFGRGGFGPGHDRIMTIFAGAGKMNSTFKSMTNAIFGSFAKSALVSFVFGTVTSIAEWKDDVTKDRYDLAAGFFMSLLKTILTAAVTSVLVAFIVFVLLVGFSYALPVILVGAGALVLSVIVGYIVEAADKKAGQLATKDDKNTDGLASVIAPAIRKAGAVVQNSWSELMKKMPADYMELTFDAP